MKLVLSWTITCITFIVCVTYIFDDLSEVGGDGDLGDIEGGLEGRPEAHHGQVLAPVVEDVRVNRLCNTKTLKFCKFLSVESVNSK